jgi:hypothetical protein
MSDNEKATLEAFAIESKRLDQELLVAAAKHKKLSKDCDKARAKSRKLQEDFQALTAGNDAMFLQLEAQRCKRMGAIFWFCVLITLVFTVGTLQRESYAWSVLNFIAFLCVWRGIYVQMNGAPMAAAVVLALVTIKFA